MNQPAAHPHRILSLAVAIMAVAAGFLGTPGQAGAWYYDVFDDAPYDQVTGLQEAIHRLYQGSMEISFHADIARFDSEANAALGLETFNAYYLDAFASVGTPLMFEPVEVPTLGGEARAYYATLETSGNQYGEAAFIQIHDGVYVYGVTVDHHGYSVNPEDVALDAAVALIAVMIASPAGIATPAPAEGGLPTGGTWDKIPNQGDEVPQRYGITYTGDDQYFALVEATPDPDAPYSGVAGLEWAGNRTYAVPGSDEDPALDTLRVYVEAAMFDDAVNAGAGFDAVADELLAVLAEDGISPDPTEVGLAADQSSAWVGEFEVEGEHAVISVIVARSGSTIVTVLTAGSGEGEVQALGEALAQSVLDAEPGNGAGEYDFDGSSTGGPWDLFPVAGDAVLNGLEPVEDGEVYPEPEFEF